MPASKSQSYQHLMSNRDRKKRFSISTLSQKSLPPKHPPKHILRRSTHPAVQYRGIDRTEINRIFQVPSLVQITQTRWLTKDPLMHRLAHNKHRGRRTMVRAQTPILLHTTPEFRPCHDYDIIRLAVIHQIGIER